MFIMDLFHVNSTMIFIDTFLW